MKYIDAVHAQGTCLARSQASIMKQLAATDLSAWRAAPLVLTGMGASYNAIATALPFYRSGLANPVSGYLASDFLAERRPRAEPPAVIAVSQSGRSREILEALQRVPAKKRFGLTAEPSAPIGGMVEAIVDLSIPGDSAVRIVGYTASVQALILVAEALAGGSPSTQAPDALIDHLERCIRLAERTSDELLGDCPLPASIDFVGAGSHSGTAAQGALLIREACRLHAASYDTYQYLHGPIEVVEQDAVLVAVGSGREVALARSVCRAGAKVLLVTGAEVAPETRMVVLRLPPLETRLSWLPAVVALQVFAWGIAQRLGLPVETFRHHQDDTKVA